MSLPSIQLDDRKFQEILDEAIALIPRYCPEWTNHNPSDPGIALLEVFAYMVEGLLWRMNRLPEKATLEYLRLLGHRLLPGRPAVAPVTFVPVDGSEPVRVPKGTVVSTRLEEGGGGVSFETEREIRVTPFGRVRLLSKVPGGLTDLTETIAGGGEGEAFSGIRQADRFLYLGDPRWQALRPGETVTIDDDGAGMVGRLDWEYWNGRGWREMAGRLEPSGEVVFTGPLSGMAERLVNGKGGWWVRGRLVGERTGRIPRLRMRAQGSGLLPDRGASDRDGTLEVPVDLSRPFLPFGGEPRTGSAFLLGSAPALGPQESHVRISFVVSDEAPGRPPAPSPDLGLRWEYHDGTSWCELGRSRAVGPPIPCSHHFTDTTAALSRTGFVSFLRPADLGPLEIGGEAIPALRCRIETGDYGLPGRYEHSGDAFVWREVRPLSPPKIEMARIDYSQVPFPPEECLSWSDFVFQDHHQALRDGLPFRPFQDQEDQSPSLYLGLGSPIPEGPTEIYFRLDDEGSPDETCRVGPEILWEIQGEDGWERLTVEDRTRGLTRSGSLLLTGPGRHPRGCAFGDDLHWVRGRLVAGAYLVAPRIRGIHPNTTTAIQGVTIRDEGIGMSSGSPYLELRTASAPVITCGPVRVREPGREGESPPWMEVDSLALSGPESMEFELDPVTGSLRFGDGHRGEIPPRGEVRVDAYRTGEGSLGNVGARTITVIRRPVTGIDSVTNPYPAEGGADPETPEEAKERALRLFRSRERAVTAEDFESLALASSRWVARAWCLPGSGGEVTLVVIPRGDRDRRPGDPLFPPGILIDEVQSYLEARRVVTTRLRCRGPAYVDIDLSLSVAPAKEEADPSSLRGRIEERLRRLFDPIEGGADGRGWPPGRTVSRSDVYEAVGAMPEVRYLEEVRCSSPGGGDPSFRVALAPHALPILSGLEVTLLDGRGGE